MKDDKKSFSPLSWLKSILDRFLAQIKRLASWLGLTKKETPKQPEEVGAPVPPPPAAEVPQQPEPETPPEQNTETQLIEKSNAALERLKTQKLQEQQQGLEEIERLVIEAKKVPMPQPIVRALVENLFKARSNIALEHFEQEPSDTNLEKLKELSRECKTQENMSELTTGTIAKNLDIAFGLKAGTITKVKP